jgi:hypothetical protein
VSVASEDTRTYYGRPVVKEPVWEPSIALYLFSGGLAGASAGLALAARLTGRQRLARRCSLVAAAAAAVSPPLLIEDLGRPERFHHMLRVFKVTSPMSVGTWVLTAFGGAAAVAATSEVTGVARPLGRAAEALAGVLGMPLATYASALLANTSIPAWHEARRLLPFAFAGSSAATAGALGSMLAPGPEGAPARRLAVGGAAAEAVCSELMQRRLGEAGRPYREGRAGWFVRASTGCTLVGAAVLGAGLGGPLAVEPRGRAARRGRRAATLAGGTLVLTGGLLGRLGIWAAGRESARQTVR